MKNSNWVGLCAAQMLLWGSIALADPTVVADFTFETSMPATAGPFAAEIGNGSALGFHAGSTVYSTPAGNGSAHSFSSTAWAIGDYYQFQVSTVGAPNVALNWDQTSSNTGPRDFVLQYSTNGTTFSTFGSQYSVLANNAPNPLWSATINHPEFNFNLDLSSVTAINNQPNVYFRLLDNSTNSAAGGTVAAGGTGRVDNFTVTIGNISQTSFTYWDTNGSAAGLGGTGVWDSGNTKNWNDSTGTGTPTAFVSASTAVFGGTAGTVTISNSSPGVVTANGGLEFDTTGYTITGDTLNLGTTPIFKVTNAADSATIASKISGTNGLTKTGDGTLVLSSTASDFTGNIALNGGTLSFSSDVNLGATSNPIVFAGGTLKSTFAGELQLSPSRGISGAAGGIDVAAGSTVTVQGTVNTTGALSLPNAGRVALFGNSTVGGVTFSKNGTLLVGSSGNGSLMLNGNITADANNTGVATINGNVTFGGTANRTISIQSPTAKVAITGAVTTNFATAGHLVVNGAGTLDIQGDNSGLINAMQIGTQNAAGPTIIAHDSSSLGSVAFGQITMFFNSGTINNQKGSPITFASSLLSSIGGAGSFPSTYAGSDMEFQGAINLFRPTGTTTNHITVNNNTTFSGGWTTTGDAGTLTNNTGVVFDGTGSVTLSSASGGSFNAMLAPLTADGITVNLNGVNPNNDGQTVTIGTTNYTATMQLTAKNNGRINLSMDNAFAGSGATPVPAKLTLSAGGALGTSGTHQTFNTLSLSGGGTIDLGSGASIVQFNDSHSQTWSGILRISNWSGSPTGSGTDQLLVGTSALTGLTSAQLAEIHFTGLPTGAKFVANGANGEVVPLSTTPLLIGDLNGDGHVNNTDITTMLTALVDLNAFKAAHPTLDSATLTDLGDLNADGAFNNLDLQGLATYIKTGHGSLSAVPEPATYVLLAMALPAMVTVVRRRVAKKSSI
jgi:autotransporter-associated beta strand protein